MDRIAGQYPYKTSSNGYASEPERNYDSDYAVKYKTLDRRRNQSSGTYVANLSLFFQTVTCMRTHDL